MAELPGGTVTFLFTDVEGSTRAWEQHDGAAMRAAVARHYELLTGCIDAHGGTVVKSLGDGLLAVFPEPAGAVVAAMESQHAMVAETWEGVEPFQVRMGLHAGAVEPTGDDYLGPPVNRAARIMACAHGGQIVVSATVAGMLRERSLDRVGLDDLGHHRLRDLREPEHLFQVTAPGLQKEFPPVRSLDAFTNNLPTQSTSFVGRESELALTGAMLAEHRLVTLTGVGGSGKTRLALEVAVRRLDYYPSGVFFVDLTSVGEPDLIAGALIRAVQIPVPAGPGGMVDLDTALRYLGTRKVLVILDNCEHLIDGAAHLVERVTAECPDVSILATSRETLEIPAEHAYLVSSLGVEDDGGDAVQLFLDRASAVRANFDPVDASRKAIVEICQRLDGIPLAIELAASRVAHMAPAEIAGRLDDRFHLLAGRRRGSLQRHQTLEATMAWSWDLLDETEQRLLRRLAVFSGGFTLAAVEGICDVPNPVDVIASLVNKSLVISELTGVGGRYRLLESVRLYAQSRLFESGEVETFRNRHRDWYRDHLSQYADPTTGPLDLGGIKGHDDLDNVRAALEWSWTRDDVVDAAELVMLNLTTWTDTHEMDEAIRWLGSIQGRDTDLPLGIRADLAAWASFAHMTRAEFDAMRDAAQDAIDLEQHGRPSLVALAYGFRGLRVIFEDSGASRRDLEHSIELAGDVPYVPAFLNTILAGLDMLDGHLEDAIDRYSSVRHECESFAGGELAIALAMAGRFDEVLSEFPFSEAEHRPSVERWSQEVARVMALSATGQQHKARQWMMQVAGKALESGWALVPHALLSGWVALAIDVGDTRRAAELLAVQRRDALTQGWRSPVGLALYRHQTHQVRQAAEPTLVEKARQEAAELVSIESVNQEEIAHAASQLLQGTSPDATPPEAADKEPAPNPNLSSFTPELPPARDRQT